MYSYLYDIFLQEGKYDRVLSELESYLAHLHLQGAITRLSVLKAMYLEGWFKDELRRGVKTFIAVGNDHTLHRMMCLTQGKDVTLGCIPVGAQNSMASVFFIPKGKEACEVISRRFIATIPLSRINDKYFLTSCSMPLPRGSTVSCDASWRFTNTRGSTLTCSNLGATIPGRTKGTVTSSSWLRKEEQSQFFFRTISLQYARDITVRYDGEEKKSSAITVEVTPLITRMIVGASYGAQTTAAKLREHL